MLINNSLVQLMLHKLVTLADHLAWLLLKLCVPVFKNQTLQVTQGKFGAKHSPEHKEH